MVCTLASNFQQQVVENFDIKQEFRNIFKISLGTLKTSLRHLQLSSEELHIF